MSPCIIIESSCDNIASCNINYLTIKSVVISARVMQNSMLCYKKLLLEYFVQDRGFVVPLPTLMVIVNVVDIMIGTPF